MINIANYLDFKIELVYDRFKLYEFKNTNSKTAKKED